jgi:hypothetical protein
MEASLVLRVDSLAQYFAYKNPQKTVHLSVHPKKSLSEYLLSQTFIFYWIPNQIKNLQALQQLPEEKDT